MSWSRVRERGREMTCPAAEAVQSRGPESTQHGPLKVLDFDPGLADGLDPEQFTAARHRVLAASALLKPTSQDFDWAWGRERSDRSLLIVGGLMVRRLTIDGRCCSEIVGPGDVVR